MDRLWPESDGDAARNAFKVCLHRLRKAAGDPRIVHRNGKRYELLAGAEVDLWRLHDAIIALRAGSDVAFDELTALRAVALEGAGKRAALGHWFAPFDLKIQRMLEDGGRFALDPRLLLRIP